MTERKKDMAKALKRIVALSFCTKYFNTDF